jgi:hypothetical protein
MTPAAAVSALDRALRIAGEQITLRRTSGTQQVPFDVEVTACVREFTPGTPEGFFVQGETAVILSPSEMEKRQWCWPPQPGDVVMTRGFNRTVRGVNPVRIGDMLVRLELAVIGDGFGR